MECFTQGVILKRAPRGFKVGEVLRSRWSIWEVLRSREATDDQYSLIDRQTFSCVLWRAALLSGIVSIVLRNLRGQVPALTVQSANSKAGDGQSDLPKIGDQMELLKAPIWSTHTHTHTSWDTLNPIHFVTVGICHKQARRYQSGNVKVFVAWFDWNPTICLPLTPPVGHHHHCWCEGHDKGFSFPKSSSTGGNSVENIFGNKDSWFLPQIFFLQQVFIFSCPSPSSETETGYSGYTTLKQRLLSRGNKLWFRCGRFIAISFTFATQPHPHCQAVCAYKVSEQIEVCESKLNGRSSSGIASWLLGRSQQKPWQIWSTFQRQWRLANLAQYWSDCWGPGQWHKL